MAGYFSSSPSPSLDNRRSFRSLLTHYHQPNRQKSLVFGMIEIFEFPVTVGDNPHVSGGCPIAMDPEAELRTIQPFDAHEKRNTPKRKKSRDQLKLSVTDRAKL
jgi:hypothetical protein